MDIFGWKRIEELESLLSKLEAEYKEQRNQKRASEREVGDLKSQLAEARRGLAEANSDMLIMRHLSDRLRKREDLARKFAGEPMSALTEEGIARAFALADAWIAAREAKQQSETNLRPSA